MGPKNKATEFTETDLLKLATAVSSTQKAILVIQTNETQRRAEQQNLEGRFKLFADKMEAGLLELSGQIGNAIHETDLRIITKAREDQQRIDYRQYAKWALPLGIMSLVVAILLTIDILARLGIV